MGTKPAAHPRHTPYKASSPMVQAPRIPTITCFVAFPLAFYEERDMVTIVLVAQLRLDYRGKRLREKSCRRFLFLFVIDLTPRM